MLAVAAAYRSGSLLMVEPGPQFEECGFERSFSAAREIIGKHECNVFAFVSLPFDLFEFLQPSIIMVNKFTGMEE